MEKAFLKMMNTIVEEAMKSPGAGAQRAVAVIGTLGTKEEIPWDRVSKFKIGWVNMSDETVFPNIELEFHEGPKYPPSPWTAEDFPGHNKVLIHEAPNSNTHLVEQNTHTTTTIETLCGKQIHTAVTAFADKMPVTCTACLEKVGVL
jgi:hypothetical protein